MRTAGLLVELAGAPTEQGGMRGKDGGRDVMNMHDASEAGDGGDVCGPSAVYMRCTCAPKQRSASRKRPCWQVAKLLPDGGRDRQRSVARGETPRVGEGVGTMLVGHGYTRRPKCVT